MNEYFPGTEYARQMNAPQGIMQDTPGSPLLGMAGKMLSGGVSREAVKKLIQEYKKAPVNIPSPSTEEVLFKNIPYKTAQKAVNVGNEALDRLGYSFDYPMGEEAHAALQKAIASRQPINPTFFSTLQSTFSDPKLPEKLDAKQVRNFLASRPGVTKDELKWSGLDDLLEQRQGKITKREILNHLEENNVQIVEMSAKSKPVGELNWSQIEAQGPTIHDTWTQPGGSNYREIKLVWGNAPGTKQFSGYTDITNAPIHDDLPRFQSPHFPGEPNILAHFRTKDRLTPDGKKVLFVEEIQSDWHQAARDAVKKLEWIKKLKAAGFEFGEDITKDIPSAPFSKTWPELAMKRIMRMAADKGYDAIGWTTGEMQSKMYNKALEKLHGLNYNSVTGELNGLGKKGNLLQTFPNTTPKGLPAIIGQKNAERLLFNPTRTFIEEDGSKWYDLIEPLSVGKEGMNFFYDTELPQVANKLTKKWGTQATKIRIQLGNDLMASDEVWKKDPRKFDDIHFLPITPAMRESAKRAFSLFMGAGAATGLTLQNLYDENRQ
jgi:hypothetical protein